MKTQKYSKAEQEIRNRLADTLKENRFLTKSKKEYKEILNQMRDNLAFYAHEIKGGSLSAIIGIIEQMSTDYGMFDEEQTQEILSTSLKGLRITAEMTDFIHPDLLKKNEIITPEDLLRNIALNEEKFMKENKLGLNLRYQQEFHRPIEIYINNAIFTGIFNTLTGDSLKWTPEYSRIEQAIRIDKGHNLEILIENKMMGSSRKSHGEGNGIGQKAVRRFTKNLGGEFSNYFTDSQILENAEKNKYHERMKFGNRNATDQILYGDKIHGTKIKIPMGNLTKQ